MTNRDGGQAYPGTYESNDKNGDWDLFHYPGMTMRQRYKIAALSIISRGEFMDMPNNAIAQIAGHLADALIAEDEAHEREGK